MGGREGEYRQAFRDVGCHPLCQARGGLQVFLNRPSQISIGGSAIGSIEDGANIFSDFGGHVLVRNIRLGIALQVELAALPGDASEDCLPGCPQAGVVVAGDQLDPAQAAGLQTLQEGPPVHFMLAQRHRKAQDLPFSG